MKKLLGLFLVPALGFASGFTGGGGSGGGGGGSPEIGGAVTSGTQYSILFVDPTAILAEDPTLFGYNKSTNRFCLGCNASSATDTFHLVGTAKFASLGAGIAHLSASGVLSSSLIVDADVDAAAAIAYSKLAALTGSRAVQTGAGGFLEASAVTSTELGYVAGVTSAIQTQLNGKQASGNYITALTGDVTATGPGSVPATLATVNSNVGSFTNSSITVNAKGLVTAASSGAAPVTSVGLSVPGTSIFGVTGSPVTTTGTLGLTTTGTSGGIPYFSSTSQLASSGALTANQLVIGGGAGAAPTALGSLGTSTTVLHGNAAGAPTFGPVSLSADVTGTVAIANGGTGRTAVLSNSFQILSPNGFGSTNTKIRKFNGTQTQVGSGITYASSATNGDTFTINTAGLYEISLIDGSSSGAVQIGVSVNSNQLTTNIASITDANRILYATAAGANVDTMISRTVRLAVNDVVRAHGDGSANGTASRFMFSIIQVGD